MARRPSGPPDWFRLVFAAAMLFAWMFHFAASVLVKEYDPPPEVNFILNPLILGMAGWVLGITIKDRRDGGQE